MIESITPPACRTRKISSSASHTINIMQTEKISANFRTERMPNRRTDTRVRRGPWRRTRTGDRPGCALGTGRSIVGASGLLEPCVTGSSAVVAIFRSGRL